MNEDTTSAASRRGLLRRASRRGLLRRASVVAAGVGTAGVASALVANPAHAAPTDPLLAGSVVDAGATTTGVTNTNVTNPTFALTNPSGPTLRLTPRNNRIPEGAPEGSFNTTTWGEVEYQYSPGLSAEFYTSFTATQTWPVTPFRALDTRGLGGISGNGRELIINPGVLDSAFKLPAGQTLLLNLTSFVKFGWAVMGQIDVQGPEQRGYLTVFPTGQQRPLAASIAFLDGWGLSNFIICGLGWTGLETETDVISIYAAVTTHVLFDVNAFIVPSVWHIAPSMRPIFGGGTTASAQGTTTSSATRRAQRVQTYQASR